MEYKRKSKVCMIPFKLLLYALWNGNKTVIVSHTGEDSEWLVKQEDRKKLNLPQEDPVSFWLPIPAWISTRQIPTTMLIKSLLRVLVECSQAFTNRYKYKTTVHSFLLSRNHILEHKFCCSCYEVKLILSGHVFWNLIL